MIQKSHRERLAHVEVSSFAFVAAIGRVFTRGRL
jgi:hypothetical protein